MKSSKVPQKLPNFNNLKKIFNSKDYQTVMQQIKGNGEVVDFVFEDVEKSAKEMKKMEIIQ